MRVLATRRGPPVKRSLAVVALVAAVALPRSAPAQQAGGTAPPQPPSSSSTTSPPQPSTQQPSTAQQPQSDAERKKLEEDIARELGASPPAAQPTPPAQAAPQGGSPTGGGATGGSPYARLLLIPDISAIGSAGAAYDSYDVGTLSPRPSPFSPPNRPEFFLEEVELGIQAVVDPYVRADIFISFTPGGVDVEEGYITTLSLPAGLQLRAGKFFSPFGRLNQQHPHIWDFVDAPLAQSRVLAQEKLSGPGVDLAWLAPLPWFTELHLAAQSTQLSEQDTPELTGVARLLQYFQLGDASTLGVGLSGALRHESGGGTRDLGGADAYLRIRPLHTRAYLAVQGEVYLRKFHDVAGQDSATVHGWWTQVFWRSDPYLGYGVRYEEAPGAQPGVSGTERRLGAVATWFPSEFLRLRLQPSWDRLPDGNNGLEVLLHVEFGIGAHGAHPF
jgi:hypothetical protein